MEHPGHRTRFAKIAAVFGEHVADFTDGAIPVVARELHQDSYSAGTVALQIELLVSGTGQLTGAALHGTFDVIRRHVLGFGSGNGGAQPRIMVGICTGGLGCHGYFPDETGENLAPLGVQGALFMLDCGPFGMARHD